VSDVIFLGLLRAQSELGDEKNHAVTLCAKASCGGHPAHAALGSGLARAQRRSYSPAMSIEQLKAELRAASPETQTELFLLLGMLRRSNDPERRRLAEKLDDPTRWAVEEDAAQRLGLND